MMPTFGELSRIDSTVWLHQARGWDDLGRDLTAQVGRLDAAFAPLDDTWIGRDARAARAARDRMRTVMAATAERGKSAAEILGRHAGAVLAAQKRLTDAVLGANPAVVEVTGEGLVLPQRLLLAAPFPILMIGLEPYLAEAARVSGEIAAALDDAARSDRQTAEELRALAPTATPTPVPATALPAPGTSPAGVRTWWDALTPEQRTRALSEHPDRIGALDGVPAAARDRANRLRLDGERTQLLRRRMRLAGRDTDAAARIDDMLRGIDAVTRRLRTGQPPALLLGFDTEHTGHAIVAVGDPDTARNVVTYVPGITARLGTVEADLQRADATVAAARAADPRAGTAAITWVGYDAPPDVVRAAAGEPAERAAEPLARFQDGLRSTHRGPPAHQTLIGHSYGSTVVGHAARLGGLQADDLVLVASPGVGTRRGVADLGLDPAHVWATVADNDPIDDVARTDRMGTSAPFARRGFLAHGLDPTLPEFGARVFDSAPGSVLPRFDDPMTSLDESTLVPSHSQYWDPGSPSWVSIGRIVVGRRDVGG